MAKKKKKDRDGVYQREDRSGYWISWTDAQGRRRARKTDAEDLDGAKVIRAAELVRVEQAKILGHAPPGRDSFEEVSERYLKHQRARLTQKAFIRESGIIEHHLTPFFKLSIASIRKMDVMRYVTERSVKVSSYTVQKELSVLKHIFSLAVEWEIVPVSPAQGVKAPKAPAGRVRYLQPTELRALLEASPEWIRPIIALAACTGMRRGEIMNLRGMDVDLLNHRIILPQTKNGDGRIVYLNQMAQTVMRSLDVGSSKLFPYSGDQVGAQFKRTCGKLKIENFRFHDLRHTAASWMRMSGADTHTVAQILGHKDLKMAVRYQHLSPAFLAEAVGKLDDVFSTSRYQDATGEKGAINESPTKLSQSNLYFPPPSASSSPTSSEGGRSVEVLWCG